MVKYIKSDNYMGFEGDAYYLVKVYGDEIYEYEFGNFEHAKQFFYDELNENKESARSSDVYKVELVKYYFNSDEEIIYTESI